MKPEEIAVAQIEAETQALAAAAEIKAQHDMTIADRFRAAVAAKRQQLLNKPTAQISDRPSLPFGYKEHAMGGVCVLLAMAIVRLGDVQIQQGFWQQQTTQTAALNTRSNIEQTTAQTQAEVAQAYQENNVAPPLPQFIIQGYSLSNEPPQGIDWGRSFPHTTSTQILDQDRFCIGRVQNGQFTFIGQDATVCNPQ